MLQNWEAFLKIKISGKEYYRARNNYWPVTLKLYQNFNTKVTETCNTDMEREFCDLLGYVQFWNIEQLIKSTDVFMCNRVDFANAHPNSNLQIRGCLRPLRPLKSYISSFSLRYHIVIACWHLRLQRDHFVIDLFLLLQGDYFKTGHPSFLLNNTLIK